MIELIWLDSTPKVKAEGDGGSIEFSDKDDGEMVPLTETGKQVFHGISSFWFGTY